MLHAQPKPGEGTRAALIQAIVVKPDQERAVIIYDSIDDGKDSYKSVRERLLAMFPQEEWVTSASGMPGGNMEYGSVHVTSNGSQFRITKVVDPGDDEQRVWAIKLGEGTELPRGASLDLALPKLWDHLAVYAEYDAYMMMIS